MHILGDVANELLETFHAIGGSDTCVHCEVFHHIEVGSHIIRESFTSHIHIHLEPVAFYACRIWYATAATQNLQTWPNYSEFYILLLALCVFCTIQQFPTNLV